MKNLAKNFALDTEFLLTFAVVEHAAATPVNNKLLADPTITR